MKRCLFTLVLFLLLGAILNVAVAWGLAVGFPVSANRPGKGGIFPLDQPNWYVAELSSPGLKWISSTAIKPGFDATDPERRLFVPPRWSIANAEPTSWETACGLIVVEQASGWPLLSQLYRWRQCGDLSYRDRDCSLSIPWPWGIAGTSDTRLLPICPMWPGLLVNSTVYACMLYGFAMAPSRLRKWLRRRRGRCVICAYDLRGNLEGGCPECGWRRDSSGEASDAVD